MKKSILAACILFGLATASHAQIEKWTILGGISGNLSFTKQLGRTTSMFGLNAYSLYALERNLAVGLSIDNTFSTVRTKGEDDLYTSYNLLVAPEFRKYFGSGRVTPYLGLSTGLSFSYFDATYPNFTPFKSYDFYLAPVAGFSYWLNDKVYFDFRTTYDLINPSTQGSPLNIKLGIGFRLGK